MESSMRMRMNIMLHCKELKMLVLKKDPVPVIILLDEVSFKVVKLFSRHYMFQKVIIRILASRDNRKMYRLKIWMKRILHCKN